MNDLKNVLYKEGEVFYVIFGLPDLGILNIHKYTIIKNFIYKDKEDNIKVHYEIKYSSYYDSELRVFESSLDNLENPVSGIDLHNKAEIISHIYSKYTNKTYNTVQLPDKREVSYNEFLTDYDLI
jgi:hypothetical protein